MVTGNGFSTIGTRNPLVKTLWLMESDPDASANRASMRALMQAPHRTLPHALYDLLTCALRRTLSADPVTA